MADKITMVTDPDDLGSDGFRVLLVDLDRTQEQTVSKTLTTVEADASIVVYIWKMADSVEWLLDKKSRSNLIIFNAGSVNQTVVGYMAAQPNSFYFSDLRDLNISADRRIQDPASCDDVFYNYIGKYERSFK
jgi:hypothetical protein